LIAIIQIDPAAIGVTQRKEVQMVCRHRAPRK
jgi:hypothetical protein